MFRVEQCLYFKWFVWKGLAKNAFSRLMHSVFLVCWLCFKFTFECNSCFWWIFTHHSLHHIKWNSFARLISGFWWNECTRTSIQLQRSVFLYLDNSNLGKCWHYRHSVKSTIPQLLHSLLVSYIIIISYIHHSKTTIACRTNEHSHWICRRQKRLY